MEKEKKIIFISSQNIFNPSSGIESRINSLVKMFSKNNTLFIFAPKQKATGRSRNYQGLIYHSRFKKLYDKRIFYKVKSIDANLVMASTLWSGINGLVTSKKLNLPFYFDNPNVEFLRFKRTNNPLWPLIYFFEKFICKRADKVICVSEIDKKYLIKYFGLNPNKIEIIENPVDKNIFYPNNSVKNRIRKELGIRKDERFILFFGQLDYQPNIEAIRIIFKKIAPKLKKNEKIVICGRGDAKGFLINNKHPQIIFRGFVDKIQDYINASDVVIAPLESGSGTRIKILETLACKKRVLSTSIGAEGIKPSKLLEIEDDWKKFVEKI